MLSKTGAGSSRVEQTAGALRVLLTLREAVVLAEVPEKRVRKDIELGVLTPPTITRISDHRLCTTWRYVFTLAAVYGNVHLTGSQRRFVLQKIDGFSAGSDFGFDFAFPAGISAKRFALDKYVSLDIEKIRDTVRPRLNLYADGLKKVHEKDTVLGGEATFCGTRLTVHHVGKMYDAGEHMEQILEDYPYLTADDVEFAKLYYHAHPRPGRPRIGGGSCVDDVPNVA